MKKIALLLLGVFLVSAYFFIQPFKQDEKAYTCYRPAKQTIAPKETLPVEAYSTPATKDKSTPIDAKKDVYKDREVHDAIGNTITSGNLIAPPTVPPISVEKQRKTVDEVVEFEYEVAEEASYDADFDAIDVVAHEMPTESTTKTTISSKDVSTRSLLKKEIFKNKSKAKEAKMKPKNTVRAKLLTAGELHDFSKWGLWKDIAQNDLKKWQDLWKINPHQRYTLQLMNQEGVPLVDALVQLKAKNGTTLWESRTDNTGKAELWNNMFRDNSRSPHAIETTYKGKTETIHEISEFQNGINHQILDARCNFPDQVDILFAVDATGSMGDEIAYLQAELQNVIAQTQEKHEDLAINLGSVFYKDTKDNYLTRKSDFSKRINKTVKFIQEQSAGGGGDYPEAVDAALEVAIDQMQWSKKAVARLLFLVLDAPPHDNPEVLAKLEKLSKKAAAKGIRIIPIAASGINKSTEYLMRSLALATNGTYVFLTDDSGIGGSHIKPTTDNFKVELLNDLLLRLINQYLQTPDCKSREELVQNITPKTDDPISNPPNLSNVPQRIKVYPNPTTGLVNLQTDQPIAELFLTDNSGKILERLTDVESGIRELRLDNYPSGMYFVRYQVDGKTLSEKIILTH